MHPPFAVSSSLNVATDCPAQVATSNAIYTVSCLEIPRRALADAIDVTSWDEANYGSRYGVEGRQIKGLPVEEVLALNFGQLECGEKGWVTAFGKHLRAATKIALEKRFDADF